MRPILPIPYDQLSSLSKPQLMRVALKHSLSAGFFVDTKIYAFSRRRLDGTVDKPSPIYANSALLRANSSYFDSCKYSMVLTIMAQLRVLTLCHRSVRCRLRREQADLVARTIPRGQTELYIRV